MAGLIVWIAYLAVGSSTLAWIAFADLVLVAVLGGVLVARWSKDRRGQPASSDGARAASTDLAEQHFPVVAVALHGVFAVTTLVPGPAHRSRRRRQVDGSPRRLEFARVRDPMCSRPEVCNAWHAVASLVSW